MFRCKLCGSTEFKLVVHPDYAGNVDISTNEHDEVVIVANDQQFVADLMFMNQFALCKCGEFHKWEYFFPRKAEENTAS